MPQKKNSRKIVLIGLISSLSITILFVSLRFFLPSFLSSNYYERNLTQLRHKTQKIKTEFSQVIRDLYSKKDLFSSDPFPQPRREIFDLLQNTVTDPEIEGASFYEKGNMTLWLGHVLDVQNILTDREGNISPEIAQSSHLIRDKVSVTLVLTHQIDQDHFIVFYRLLAFLPEIKASYLQDYHFLNKKLLKNCTLEYWDFREDVSGFESLFARNDDEYLGQPRVPEDIQTTIFPLRNTSQKIMATVSLNSPSLISKTNQTKEDLVLIFYLSAIVTLTLLSLYAIKYMVFFRKRKGMLFLFMVFLLFGLRTLFILLSYSSRFQSLSIFSPSSAGFVSLWDFTKSPADIFLSAFFLFVLFGYFSFQIKSFIEKPVKKTTSIFSYLAPLFAFTAVIALLVLFEMLLFRLVFHSNLNLMRFNFSPSFILIHLSIIFFFLSFFIVCFFIMKTMIQISSRFILLIPPFIITFVLVFILVKQDLLIFLSQVFVVVLLGALCLFPEKAKRKRIISVVFFVAVAFVFISIQTADLARNRAIIESSPPNIILSQKNWGFFLTEQSLLEIDNKSETIRSYFLQPEPINLAQSLWQETYLAKLNMYSSLVLMTPQGDFLSYFSLNVPEIYFTSLDLPVSEEWQIFRENIPFLGKEKDFLVAYKDWYEDQDPIGRTILYVSIDYETLPFLYTANPYFEVLRATSIPSLNQLDLGFAVFDRDGRLIFNPHNISTGIPPKTMNMIMTTEGPVWSSFTDKKKDFKSFYFLEQNRIYSLFIPSRGFLSYLLEFLKLMFMYLTLFLATTLFITLISSKERIKKVFWSFSNRVYISFFLVALIPLLLFTLSTRSFFANTYTQQMNEKAEIHAEFAQRVMEDYIYLELEEEASVILPSDEIVLWISSTISNDVNLYQDGKLLSSSRREFFDSGLISEIINGEVFYKMKYENNPYYTQIQKIGDYSFHTLTMPYSFQDSQLFISLPFPFEEQELSKATKDLLEFLFLISVFFILAVILFARGIGGMIIRPIKKLLSGTQQVSLGNLEFSIEYNQQDEMKTLINGFNEMVSGLKKHRQDLADMSKKVAWAEMARKVAHEIKNPLTPIQLSAEHLLQVYEEDRKNFGKALKESTSYIIHEVENLRKIAHEFMKVSKESTLHQETFNLKEAIATTIGQYKNILSHRIRFHESYQNDNIPFHGDKAKIITALRNIFTNAIEAIQEKGEIKISVITDCSSRVQIEIEDTGIGIAQEIIDRIFETFFSTKDIGTGLGLPIAKKIIEDHNGSIQAESSSKKGTRIIIQLPISPEKGNKNIPLPTDSND